MNSAKAYAEVIVGITARKLDKVFNYRVPQVLQDTLAEGMRVVVPFGRRTVEGYVIGFCDKPDLPEKDIKDIISKVEQDALLGADLLSLSGWISERYMCSKLDAIKAIMPSGARIVGKKILVPRLPPVDPGTIEVLNLKEREKELYYEVAEAGKTPYNELLKKYGERQTRDIVKKLVELNLIDVTNQLKPKVGPRVVKKYGLGIKDEHIKDILAVLESSAPKQATVLKTVIERGFLSQGNLARLAGTTPATVRELVRKGYIICRDSEIRRDPFASASFKPTEPLKLTYDQASVLKKISGSVTKNENQVYLLHGVTGSGKTEIYLQAIDHCLDVGKQAIVLVPEISLTPQMVERFKGRFGDLVAVLHSRLSDGERFDEWNQVKSGSVQIVVGARSAVFAPFAKLGLIIIDEEHEPSYKQEDNPKYYARDVAIARSQLSGSVVVLGSATPSLETYARAMAGKYRLLRLENRVTGQPLPQVNIVDMRKEMSEGNRSIFSRELIEKTKNALERGEQAVLFLNRRGYSTFVVCRECGLVMKCPKCSITLTMHAGEKLLRCHYCDFQRPSPDICPKCDSKSIRHFGTGTQKVEEEVAKWFPGARVARMDTDTTTRKGSHEKILSAFKKRETDILIGTQMIAKGLDFPGVTVVGVITADTSLNLPDFRASERTFQLMTQVAGRAGRGSMPGEVIIQTYNPDHYSIVKAQEHDYLGFYRDEMKVRASLGYPPYCSLVRIVISGYEENTVIRSSEILAAALKIKFTQHNLGIDTPLLGPAPAPLSKLRNKYRWQFCIRGKPGSLIRRLLKETVNILHNEGALTNVGFSIDVDPINMM